MARVRLGETTVKDALKVISALCCSIAAGFLLYWKYPCWWALYRPTMALADALMVAGIIGVLVEIFAVRHIIDKTAEKLADEMTGRGLPLNIKSKITAIANTTLARTNYKKRYSLTDVGNGMLKVRTETTFNVGNYGREAEKFTPMMDEERVFHPKFKYLRYSLDGVEHSFDEDTLKYTDKHGTGTTLQAAGKDTVKILPLRSDPNSPPDPRVVCEVKWVLETIMETSWFDLTEFRYPTENVEIYLEQKPEDVEFFCTGKTVDSKTWEFDEPFMVGQQLKVWWKKKK
jgi:hypothetical protein